MEERWGVTQNVFHLKRKGLHNYRISTWCTVQFQIGESEEASKLKIMIPSLSPREIYK